MIQAIQVLRFHLLELEKVHELCDDFCFRYIDRLKGKMPSELSLEDKDSNSNDNQHLNQSMNTSIGSNNVSGPSTSGYQTNDFMTNSLSHSSSYPSLPVTSSTPLLPTTHTQQQPPQPQMKLENDFNNNSNGFHQNGQAYGGFLDCSTPGVQTYAYNNFAHPVAAAAAAAAVAAASYPGSLLPNSPANPSNPNYVQPFLNPASSGPHHLLGQQAHNHHHNPHHHHHHHHPYLFTHNNNNPQSLHQLHNHHEYNSSPNSGLNDSNPSSDYYHKNDFNKVCSKSDFLKRKIIKKNIKFHFFKKSHLNRAGSHNNLLNDDTRSSHSLEASSQLASLTYQNSSHNLDTNSETGTFLN